MKLRNGSDTLTKFATKSKTKTHEKPEPSFTDDKFWWVKTHCKLANDMGPNCYELPMEVGYTTDDGYFDLILGRNVTEAVPLTEEEMV
ncbi:hypothetical protein GIB67_015855 [Kingdonia uniflora]|nr:hypothetical protein GIB67_015855 [Kingdonia uniflora]